MKSVADWLQRGYTEAVLMETGMRRNECMKRLSKVSCGLLLTASLLIGAMLSGCGQTTDYTAEIREYQNKLESLAAENEELKAQLGITETQSTEENQTAAETENQSQEMVSENQTTETDVQQAENTDNSGDEMKILVLGDSIWGNYRDDTGVSARLAACLAQEGKNATVYNGAIGGTRATISPDDNEYQFGPASDCSLGKMISILRGNTDVEMLQGKAAYDDIKAVMNVKDQIDVVILSYGMNDFLAQAPINNSDRPWTGFGTALSEGVKGVRSVFPQAQILITSPNYASYFPVPVKNMGEKALYNYASIACDVAVGHGTLCVDAYDNLGVDAYNADEYLEDGIHLNEKGRSLYAKTIASCLLYGTAGQISGNNIASFN